MKPEIVATALPFAEGPVWCPDGTLVITHVAPGCLRRIWPESGKSEIIARTRGGANAAQLAADGGFVVTQNGGFDFSAIADMLGLARDTIPPLDAVEPGLQRVGPSGEVNYLARGGLHAPNDLVVTPDGTLYFTDPGPYPPEESGAGRVLACSRDGGFHTVADGFLYDNGIALSPGGRILVVEALGLMWIDRDGRKEWLVEQLPGASPADGLSFDRDGRIYVVAPMDHCVRVLDPDGKEVDVLEAGEGALPTNCCFGGADGRTLFVTELTPGRVLAFEGMPAPGLPLTPWLGG